MAIGKLKYGAFWFMGTIGLCLIGLLAFYHWVKPDYPVLTQSDHAHAGVEVVESGNFRKIDNNWLQMNQHGMWELYVEGAPFERGLVYGQLAIQQVQEQEVYFVDQIKEMVPSEFMLSFLKYFIAWFNRDIDDHIPEEYKKEILGISKVFSDDYDYIAPKYYRILNYHAAHDIGHALKDLMLVGCTSFANWGPYSEDRKLLIGRNFDFYVGDDFAKNKLITFMKPDQGHPFVSVSWGGMIGVVSGMNIRGLTVTINAARSDIPKGSKTPISILAREILQYASTIDEAFEIAKQREVFVSESLLIGSALDGEAAIIEKGPLKMGLYRPENGQLICSNHYQSASLVNDPENVTNILKSDSKSRFDRMSELLNVQGSLNVKGAVSILRDRYGQDGKDIGLANPKAINQLLAHHGVVFKPAKRQIWISANPFQLGEFICYDLGKVFQMAPEIDRNTSITEQDLMIPRDTFLLSKEYADFKYFHAIRKKIIKSTSSGSLLELSKDQIDSFIQSNTNSYLTYMYLGDHYRNQDLLDSAFKYYSQSLKHEVASVSERENIESLLKECNTD